MLEEIILSLNWSVYLLFLGLINTIGFLFLKRVIYSWFDPLLFYLVSNSFGLAFIFYIFFIEHDISIFYFSIICVNILFFSAGLLLGQTRKQKGQVILSESSRKEVFKYSKWLNLMLKIVLAILLISNVVLILRFGSPALFSENPSISKVEYRTGGFGIIHKIGEVFFPLALSIIFLKLFHPVIAQPKSQVLLLSFFAALVFFLVSLGGSKSGAFTILDTLFYMYLMNTYYSSSQKLAQIKKVSLIVLLSCIFLFLLVLSFSFRQSFSLFEGLVLRFLGSFDGIYYFSRFDLYSSFQFSPIDFFVRLVNPFLGFFRISDYEPGIGELIFEQATGFPVSGFGPNSTFILESLIFFGPYFSWAYSFFVGYLVSFVRTSFLLKVLKYPTQLNLVIYIMCSIFILRLPFESNMMSTALLGTIVFIFPVFIISGILGKFSFKKMNTEHYLSKSRA
jgi:hypothetical protein